jgi:bacteriocin-like protein
MALRPPETVSTRTQMETTMSNSSKTTNVSSRELTADELNQVTGGMGPVLIFRQATSIVDGIRGETLDDKHKDWIEWPMN